MILGIDAANIRAGGGVTHLTELLAAGNPGHHGFAKVIVWSGNDTLTKLDERHWLVKSHQPMLDGNLLIRVWWQRFQLSRLARAAGCDLVYVPGGSYAGTFRPVVTFSQNLLPFEWPELCRYGWSWMTLKLLLLRVAQARAFRKAAGLIFLSAYAREAVIRVTRGLAGPTTIIPHGVDPRFTLPPRPQEPIGSYSSARPLRLLYVSVVDVYKHQWNVARAVAKLRGEGLPLTLDLVGPGKPRAVGKLRETLAEVDPGGNCVRYLGAVPHRELHAIYAQADLGVFASSCETFGQILTEAMSSGLPIACSNRSAMPEMLGDAGIYFDPENPDDIARALRQLINSPALRQELAEAAFERAQTYSWQRCAEETFEFLSKVSQRNKSHDPERAASATSILAAR